MNRPRRARGPFPPCFYAKHGGFYLVKNNKWTHLGTELGAALTEYARLVETAKIGGMPKLIEDYYSDLPKTLADSTRIQYRHAADVLKRKLKPFEPHQVKSRHVAGIKQSMADKPNMANRVISFLRGVFAQAVEDQLVDSNPCVGVRRFKEPKRTRLITEGEWWSIFDNAGPRLRVIMKLQFLTGQRIVDVLNIRRSQITEAGIEFVQKKTGSKLTVVWSPDLKAAVAEAEALHKGPKALTLLRGRYGGPPDYSSVHLQWQKACAAAGVVDARPNDQRAQSLTATRRQGKDPTALAGHTSVAMTERYLRDRETPDVQGPTMPRRKA